MSEAVNHPKHYRGNKFEVIDIIEDFGLDFHLGNVIKYVLRAGKKDNNAREQDLEKARWYLNRAIDIRKSPVGDFGPSAPDTATGIGKTPDATTVIGKTLVYV